MRSAGITVGPLTGDIMLVPVRNLLLLYSGYCVGESLFYLDTYLCVLRQHGGRARVGLGEKVLVEEQG